MEKNNETADNDAEKFVREKLNASSSANPYAVEIIFPQDAPKEIRGNFLSKLLLSLTKIRLLIEGATIVGPVTIEGLTLSGTYLFRRCVFSEEFNLEGSTLQGSLSFDRCSINAINLCGTKVTGRLFFKNLSNSPECPHRPILFLNSAEIYRSEERRVGKECA